MTDWASQLLDRAAKVVPQIDLDHLANVPRDKVREFFAALPESERTQLMNWAKAATEIRQDGSLSKKEKDSRILALDTTATIFGLLRALLDAVARQAPENSQRLVRNGLGIAAVAAAGLNFEITGLAAIAVRAGLPAFVQSEAGGKFCAFILAHDTLPKTEEVKA